MKRAFITGTTGQDGSYLTELLLGKGYTVHGLVRRASTSSMERLQGILGNPNLVLHTGDMTDAGSIQLALAKAQPDEIYNLAGMSDVRASYDVPFSAMDINAGGLARLLEAARQTCPTAKIYQASSSEMFGKVQQVPQTETTPFYPRSPYGSSKAAAFYLGRTYRQGYGMQIYNGILFNHESPRRGEQFLSRKVCKAVARIQAGLQESLTLGNMEAKRDWGYAKEYAQWIWRIVQHDEPDDFLLATGETHTVQEFVEVAFAHAGLDWERYVQTDPALKRPAEVDLLIGDASKSRRVLGYEPKVKFQELVQIMVDAEMEALCSSTRTIGVY
jgi:GDPmannose 4,6-dehydratase